MTIGPEPSTRILFRSSRRGTEGPQELVEEAERVVRPRPGLRVVLDAARGDVEQADALDRAVVEVHVGQLSVAQVRLDDREGLGRFPGDGEAVVLGGDGDPSRSEVFDGVVGTAVTEWQL